MANSLNSNSRLVQHLLKSQGHESFPHDKVDYYDRFVRIDNYLNKNIHPHANTGATAREPIWLTDHGPQHIATVIRRADDLVFTDTCLLTPYEAYILLFAAHVHDAGNIFGRKDHEKKVSKVMFSLESELAGKNNVEKRMICSIAMAHSGYVDSEDNKDTIGRLPFDDLPSHPHAVRVRKLAAVLRFADELAEDNTRTNRFVQHASKKPFPGSEIFHEYAARQQPPQICHDTRSINLQFELTPEIVQKRYLKGKTRKYLFEEIRDRTLKTHREHIYCKRFMLPEILLERINVSIEVCTDNYHHVLGEIRYTLAEDGYPVSPRRIGDVCPDVAKLTGSQLKKRVKTLLKNQNGFPCTSPQDLLSLED